MPELPGYTYSQQLMLELVKSQYGAVVIGVLIFPVFGVTLAALLAPILALLLPEISPGGRAAFEGLTPRQWLGIIINPGSAGLYLGAADALEIEQKVRELNLGNQLKRALGL